MSSSLTLQNSVLTPAQLIESPSSKDGICEAKENQYRFVGGNLIESAGILLRLPQAAMATACVLFQRFFYTSSFKKHSILKVAMGSLFLACKIEECSRKIRDIINVFYYLQCQFNKVKYEPMEYSGKEFFLMKDAMIDGELLILTSLGFNVRVQHPYGYLINYLQALELHQNKEISQRAWNYLNDSLRTNLHVCYQPSNIACAVIYRAAKDLKIGLPISPPWWEVFGACEADMISIGHRLKDLYQIDLSDSISLNGI